MTLQTSMKHKLDSKLKVAVLFGGRSAEHEISILTALQAISAMDSIRYEVFPIYLHASGKFFIGDRLFDKNFYRTFSSDQVEEVTLLADPASKGCVNVKTKKVIPVDVYFLCFHGQYGEDGCIQGLLELKQAVYTGCNVIASSVTMNKYLCKILLREFDIPTLPHALVKKQDARTNFSHTVEKITSTKGLEAFPLFIKPNHLGSSIGVSVAYDRASLQEALARGFYYDDELLVEPCITHLAEINVAVLDGRISVCEMPVSSTGTLSFEDKYLRGGSKDGASSGMASLTRVIDPNIDPALKEKIRAFAHTAYHALGCSGVARLDFMIDLDSGKIYFNELNPIPGSLAFYLWEKSDPPLLYTEVLDILIEQAVNARKMRLSLQQNLAFKAIK